MNIPPSSLAAVIGLPTVVVGAAMAYSTDPAFVIGPFSGCRTSGLEWLGAVRFARRAPSGSAPAASNRVKVDPAWRPGQEQPEVTSKTGQRRPKIKVHMHMWRMTILSGFRSAPARNLPEIAEFRCQSCEKLCYRFASRS